MKTTTRLALAILSFSAATTGAFAQAGILDPTFATAGIGTYLPDVQSIAGYEIITLADNSMLVGGASSTAGFVMHILENGTLDTSFGENNGYTFIGNVYMTEMAIAPDQSIYLAGAGIGTGVVLAHLSASGIPDTDFGTDGVVLTSIAPSYPELHGMLVQPDGKVVVAGFGEIVPANLDADFFFIRYLPDGNLDTGFGNGGIVNFETPTDVESIFALALMADGSILGAGTTVSMSDGVNHNLVVKLNPDGTPEGSFGNAGVLLPSVGGMNEQIDAILVDQGSIYISGSISQGTYMAKLNADGTFDPAFGTGGITVIDLGDSFFPKCLAAQADGKIVACGMFYGSGAYDSITVRYDTNGSLDTSYGDAGKTITNYGNNDSYLWGLAIQSDGKIVCTGGMYGADLNSSVIVLRYFGDGTIGIADTDSSTGQFAIYPNPVAGTSTQLGLRDASGAEIWITDLQGRIACSSINVPKGMTSVDILTAGLANGNYLINVLSQGTITSLKMQVDK